MKFVKKLTALLVMAGIVTAFLPGALVGAAENTPAAYGRHPLSKGG